MLDDSYDVSSAVKEGSWLYRKAQAAIKICIDTINHFNNITGWSIYNDNADNIVGAYLMYHYLSLFTNNGDYYSDTVSLRRHILDSLYTIASPVVRNYIPNRKEYETSLHQAEVSNGNRFKDFSGVDFSTKKTILLSQFIEGKVAVIDFWASWCGPCRKEIEETLKPLYNKYADKGLVVVGIGVWDEVEKYDKAVKDLEITFPQLFDADRNNSTTLYGVQSIPMVFLINCDGAILGNYRGDELVKAVENALGIKQEQ